MRRYELTDQRWELISDLMPRFGSAGGRPWRDHRQVLNGVFWILHTGAQWRELPERYGPWKTVYGRFRRWQREGLVDRILQRLQVRLDKEGRIDWDLFCIDGTSIRASRSAAGARHAAGASKRGAVRKSPTTTHWVAAEAAGDPSCIWSLTVREFPSPRR